MFFRLRHDLKCALAHSQSPCWDVNMWSRRGERRAGRRSFYAPYLGTLPTLSQLKRSNLFFSEEKLLEEFWFLFSARQIAMDQKMVKHAHSFNTNADSDLFTWAYLIVKSYAFSSYQGGLYLVPIFDLFNTGLPQERNVMWYPHPIVQLQDHQKVVTSPESVVWSYKMVSTRDIQGGTEMLDRYSTQNNELLALGWSLTLPGNPKKIDAFNFSGCLQWTSSRVHRKNPPSNQRRIFETLAGEVCGKV